MFHLHIEPIYGKPFIALCFCSIPIGCPLTPPANQFSILPGEKGCFVAYPTGDRPLKP